MGYANKPLPRQSGKLMEIPVQCPNYQRNKRILPVFNWSSLGLADFCLQDHNQNFTQYLFFQNCSQDMTSFIVRDFYVMLLAYAKSVKCLNRNEDKSRFD
ncbi:hypothetical protein ACU8KH_00583 [Lachancea thermotolerans]